MYRVALKIDLSESMDCKEPLGSSKRMMKV